MACRNANVRKQKVMPRVTNAVLKVFGLESQTIFMWPVRVEKPLIGRVSVKPWRTQPEEA
jgi:hypothetical protein